MEDTFVFNKSLEQRLADFNNLFPPIILSSQEIRRTWTHYLEVMVDRSGWHAIWKVPRLTCEKLDIAYPTIVLVRISSIDYIAMDALVEVMSVMDDISIPEETRVPLIELWLTETQDPELSVDVYEAAEALDALRFFYVNIWMPWDEDREKNWKRKHFVQRLKLYYALKEGTIPKTMATLIESLLSEARLLNSMRLTVESELDPDEEDLLDKIKALKMTKAKLSLIRTKIEMYEDPILFDILIKRHLNSGLISEQGGPKTIAIPAKGTAKDFINFFQKVAIKRPSEPPEKVFVRNNLAACLQEGNREDQLVLDKGEHQVFDCIYLENNAALQGIDQPNETVLLSYADSVSMYSRGHVLVESLVINSNSSRWAILVATGKTVIRNCKIIGEPSNATLKGVLVLKDAELEMTNCEMKQFSISIVGNPGSKITLENCVIHSSTQGLKVFENSDVNLHNVQINNSETYGMVIETVDGNEDKVADCDILKTIPSFTVENVTGEHNKFGNILLNAQDNN